jgi:hypothetical protein
MEPMNLTSEVFEKTLANKTLGIPSSMGFQAATKGSICAYHRNYKTLVRNVPAMNRTCDDVDAA